MFFYLTMEFTKEEVKKRIIIRLVRWKKWGGSHTENIIGGLPSHMKGNKVTKQAIKELERAEWIISAIKTGETHYSLNPRKTDEILEFYEKYCKG